MKSTRSWLNTAIIKENFKRFWPVATVAFFFWFLCMPFVVLMDEYSDTSLIKNMMVNQDAGTFTLGLAVPIAMALLCFSYLHRSNSAGVMHAMPCTRLSLYVSNWISGFLLTLAPIALTGIIMVIIQRPTMLDGANIFTTGTVLKWFAGEVLIAFFIYSIAVLAGMVSGNTVIHGLTAVAFNFLVPVLYLIFMGYGDIYLYGFEYSDLHMLLKFSPYIAIFDGTGLDRGDILLFGIIALVISVGGYFIYSKRPLERTGDSYVFKPVTWAIGFLIIFIFSSLTGFLFQYDLGYLSYGIGILIGWVLGQMIANKTTKIFRKDCIVVGLIAAIAVASVVTAYERDVMDLETYVPKAAEVQSVKINVSPLNFGIMDNKGVYSDIEDIEDITAMHENLAADIDYLEKCYKEGCDEPTGYVDLIYTLNNGKIVRRAYYTVPRTVMASDVNLESLWNRSIEKSTYEWLLNAPVENIQIDMEYYDNNGSEWCFFDYGKDGAELKDALRNAIVTDVKENSFAVSIGADGDIAGYFNVYVRTPVSEKDKDYDEYYNQVDGYYEYYEGEGDSLRYRIQNTNFSIMKSYSNLNALREEVIAYNQGKSY